MTIKTSTINILIVSLLFFYSFSIQAQNQFTLSGQIKDAETGEFLVGVTVYLPQYKQGNITNAYGFYSVTLPSSSDSIDVRYSYVGYQSKILKLAPNQNHNLNMELETGQELNEVVVSAESLQEKLERTQMGVETLTMKDIKNIPVIFGEADIIKILQFKPGVTSGGEGSSGLFVRGGSNDQNLVLLDETLIYNPSHLFGFFSVFNPDVVRAVDLYKSDFPAQYGGRLSSIMDVKLREGNNKKFSGTGGIGLISSRLTLEGPIQKEKSSFLIAGRRTYFDIFTRAINRANQDDPDYSPIPDYFFYDLDAKLNFKLSDKDQLFIGGYLGRDVFHFENESFNFDFNWGNTSATVRWNHIFNPKLFANFSAFYTDYQYEIRNRFDIFSFNLGSHIRDVGVKLDFDWLPFNNSHLIRFGASFTNHSFEIGRIELGSDDNSFNFNSNLARGGNEFGAYINDEIEISERLKTNVGLRISGFQNQGNTDVGLEPRVSARYKLSDVIALKGSFARMYQYLHLVGNSGASLPTDIWYPTTKVVNPQRSDQSSLGLSFLLGKGKYLLTTEGYYKDMQNQLDLKDGAQIFANPALENEFVFGRGWSYGGEIYIEKKEGRTTGWLGYTLSWTWRKFGESNGNPAINNGEAFHPRYDRRHDISAVITHQLNRRFTLTLAWVYNTGNAFSLPTQIAAFQGAEGTEPLFVPVYEARNTFRLPDYHRLDIGLVWKFFPRWGASDLTFSIYNAYNRRNAYFIFVEAITQGEDNSQTLLDTQRFQAKQVALFPVIPTLTYNFRF